MTNSRFPKSTEAVDFHSEIAARFSTRYDLSENFRRRYAKWSQLIAETLRPGELVLDAGCGPAHLSHFCAGRGAVVTALDGSPVMLDVARRNLDPSMHDRVTFVQGLIGDETALAGRAYDLVLCSSVLEYVDDLDGAMDWLLRRLAPGGRLIFSMPNSRSVFRRIETLTFGVTGRPRYRKYVKFAFDRPRALAALRRNGCDLSALHYYASADVVGRALQALGMEQASSPLVVALATRAA